MVAQKDFMMKIETEEVPTTTRRYPRTLHEAFPHDPEYSEWFYESETSWCGWDYIFMAVFAVLWATIVWFMVHFGCSR